MRSSLHTLVLGLQWGDEGKGKLVDTLSATHDIVVRFNGGSNAGHSIYRDGIKYAVHQLPAGIFHRKILVIANGCVVDPIKLAEEINGFKRLGLLPNLLISDRAHVVMLSHILRDMKQEKSRGKDKIGTTLSGNGPVHADKAARTGLRMGEAVCMTPKQLRERLVDNVNVSSHDEDFLDYYAKFLLALNQLRPYVTDTVAFLNEKYKTNTILLAGAHGTLLDVEHGDYPMVTSSNVCLGGAIQGTGLSLRKDLQVIGVIRPYATRVGGGDMRGEMTLEDQTKIRELGNEYGTTTGRARRVSWLDLDQLKRHVNINGVDEIALMKVDVMYGFPQVSYVRNHELHTQPGWNDFSNERSNGIHPNLHTFLSAIEADTDVRVKKISYGTDPKDIYWRD